MEGSSPDLHGLEEISGLNLERRGLILEPVLLRNLDQSSLAEREQLSGNPDSSFQMRSSQLTDSLNQQPVWSSQERFPSHNSTARKLRDINEQSKATIKHQSDKITRMSQEIDQMLQEQAKVKALLKRT